MAISTIVSVTNGELVICRRRNSVCLTMLDVVHVKRADDDAEGTNGLHTKLLSRITYRKIVIRVY
ncbi:MAG: hypothetical protein R3A10_10620 [Caldilineaceae bacterium]